jgi:fructose-1,6-bisphosphatase
MTTTGFATLDFDKWPQLCKTLLALLMLTGAWHAPFTTREKAVKFGLDILSETKVLEFEESRRYVRDTDQGAEIKEQIDDLYQLLEAYRNGSIHN